MSKFQSSACDVISFLCLLHLFVYTITGYRHHDYFVLIHHIMTTYTIHVHVYTIYPCHLQSISFPDLKECELARAEWQGGRYQVATFTTIEAVTDFLGGDGSYSAPWGAAIANAANKVLGAGDKGGDAGLLGDTGALDQLVRGENGNAPSTLNLVIQPGNGGPVEDWINCEKIYEASPDTVMVIVNGALDKVRDGYYPGIFFPKLAATVDRFYKKFESVFYLKPISDKGVYGWLYRVYPEASFI